LYHLLVSDSVILTHRNQDAPRCRSLVLSSAPASIKQANEDWDRLYEEATAASKLPLWLYDPFWDKHVCRSKFGNIRFLDDAYLKKASIMAGIDSTTDNVNQYEAQPIRRRKRDKTVASKLEKGELHLDPAFPPVLLLRGEHDFVQRSNIERWQYLLPNKNLLELKDCSHHGLLEQPGLYGRTLEAFWKSVEASKGSEKQYPAQRSEHKGFSQKSQNEAPEGMKP